MGGRFGRAAAVACASLSIAMAATAVVAAAPAQAASIAEVAPYFEPTAVHPANLQSAITGHGLKGFTAAFVLGKGCAATWDDGTVITGNDARSKLVKNGQSAGATAIISFGGQSGSELAKTCTNQASLVAAYTNVINKFNVRRIDFDIEGKAPLNDTATNTRRYQAIKTLESKFANLEVSVTIPVGLSGIDATPTYGNGMAFLKLAKSTGARIDVVNIMTMNYGGAIADMGATSVSVARKAMTQIKSIWPAAGYKNLGITPMIGQNDVAGETFTYANAQTVVRFAHNNGVRRLAFWAIHRDQACGGADHAPGSCTGLAQAPLDFVDAFLD